MLSIYRLSHLQVCMSEMFAPYRNPAQAYRAVEVQTGTATASPHQLITLLYEGAITALGEAKAFMQQNKLGEKGAKIGKAIRIIEEGLKASVDVAAGGDVATNLRDLYDYMVQRLLEANARNEEAGLVEVTQLLADLRETWMAIAPPEPRASTLSALG